MTEDIVHEATYPYPPEAVWKAITTPAAMSAWLMDTTFAGPQVGHKFEFRDKPRKVMGWDGVTQCEVVEAAPPRRFVFQFGDGRNGFAPTWISWDLEPVEGGTRVRFRHWGFGGLKGWMMRQGMNNGWGGIVRHAIPFVVARMLQGEVPPRGEVKAAARKGREEAAGRVATAR
jgi:uncharacterized protein YndB with AHSA1/START domain